MKHHRHGARMPVQECEQFLRRNDVRYLTLREIAPFAVATQPIAHDEIALAPVFEAGEEVRPDEAGAARNDDHDADL